MLKIRRDKGKPIKFSKVIAGSLFEESNKVCMKSQIYDSNQLYYNAFCLTDGLFMCVGADEEVHPLLGTLIIGSVNL